jgi:hypothetical protein
MGANIDRTPRRRGAGARGLPAAKSNPPDLARVAVTALGQNNSVITALAAHDWITTKSFQFTADIAAVGPFGRGYRRVKFIFDTSDGTPKIFTARI